MSSEENGRLLPDGGTTIEVNYSEEESPTYAVVKGLADLKGIADTEVDPLYNQVQTESMNRLLHQAQISGRYVGLEFTIGEYTVLVKSEGEVVIYEDNPVTKNVQANQ